MRILKTLDMVAARHNALPAQIAIAFPRSSPVKTFAMIERVAGMINAAPMPIAARTAITWSAESAKTVLVLLPAAAWEEFAFRGVPMVLLAAAFGRLPAVLVTSVAFAVLHGLNPSVTPLGLANIGLAGIFLAMAFWAPGGIWTAIGAHLGWNAVMASLDAPVSGLPFAMPFIDYAPGAPAWLTGGGFGPEGGVLATLTILGATTAALRWQRKDVVA